MKYTVAFLLAFIMVFSPVAAEAAGVMTETPYTTYNLDKWGNAVPSPNGYLPVRNITGSMLGVGELSDPQDLFYHRPSGEVYLADSGANRIIVLNENGELLRVMEQFTYQGEPYALSRPTGVYVTPEGVVYICDQDNGKVVKCDRDGNILTLYGAPQSDLIASETPYRPSRIVVDSYHKMYVQAQGVFEGIYCLTADGTFINYFGANHINMTFAHYAEQALRRMMTIQQRRSRQSFVPIEYSNLFIDAENFIYATVTSTVSEGTMGSGIEDTKQDIYVSNKNELIRKLNALGVNILNKTNMSWFMNAAFTDITVDENGVMSMCDSLLGVIYQCDANGKLMFAFGGLGAQLGLFSRPVSIIEVGGHLWVLDADKRNITLFELTEFGRSVHQAMKLYNDGRYQEDIAVWESVIRSDANYLLAYTGLGKAYYQVEDYEKSMYYFKLANDRISYSDAFQEHSLRVVRAHFGWFFGGVLVVCLTLVLRPVVRKRLKSRVRAL